MRPQGFAVAGFFVLSIIASASSAEQLSDSKVSKGASFSVCVGTFQGAVRNFGSSTVASITSVSASMRR